MDVPIVRRGAREALSGRCQWTDSGIVVRSPSGEHARLPRSRPARGGRRRAAACARRDAAAKRSRDPPAPRRRDRLERSAHRRALGRAASCGCADRASAARVAASQGARTARCACHASAWLRPRDLARAGRPRALPRGSSSAGAASSTQRPTWPRGRFARRSSSGADSRSRISRTSGLRRRRAASSRRSGWPRSRRGSTPTSPAGSMRSWSASSRRSFERTRCASGCAHSRCWPSIAPGVSPSARRVRGCAPDARLRARPRARPGAPGAAAGDPHPGRVLASSAGAGQAEATALDRARRDRGRLCAPRRCACSACPPRRRRFGVDSGRGRRNGRRDRRRVG